MTFQGDPVRDLEPTGEPWMGIVYPGVTLLASIVVSFLLYWRFARRRRQA